MEMMFNVGDIKSIIMESSNEFKAKLGDGVESNDKKNNEKAYKDAEKRAKDFDGGLAKEVGEEKAKIEKADFNKTTLDYTPDNVTPEYKERVKAQAEGYTSTLEKENGIEKQGDFEGNKNIYNAIKNSGEEMHDNEVAFKKTGLQASKMPDKVFKKEEMYESKEGFEMKQILESLRNIQNETVSENKNIKTVYFKKTEFITEGYMLSRIPDEFKQEGCRFKMKDKTGSEYLMEWKNNTGKVLSHTNELGLKSSLNEMNDLIAYKSKESSTTCATRLNENDTTFENILNKVRDLK